MRRLNNLELSDKAFHAFVRKYDRDNTGYIPYSEVYTAEPHNSWWCMDSCCQCPAHVSNTCTLVLQPHHHHHCYSSTRLCVACCNALLVEDARRLHPRLGEGHHSPRAACAVGVMAPLSTAAAASQCSGKSACFWRQPSSHTCVWFTHAFLVVVTHRNRTAQGSRPCLGSAELVCAESTRAHERH